MTKTRGKAAAAAAAANPTTAVAAAAAETRAADAASDQASKQNNQEATSDDCEQKIDHLSGQYISNAFGVQMALGTALCFVNIINDVIINLNVNQAAPQEGKIITLMKSFTKWAATEMKSFNADKMITFLCSKCGLNRGDLRNYVSLASL